MRNLMCFFFVLSLQSASLAGEKEDEIEKFVGTWKPIALTNNGQELPKKFLPDWEYEFTERNFVISYDDQEVTGKFFIDLKASPKTLDLFSEAIELDGTNFKMKYVRSSGIYKFDGESLVLCFDMKERMKRPEEFKSPKGSTIMLMTLGLVK